MSGICPECYGPPKSMCFNTRCPYRRRQLDNDDTLDFLTAAFETACNATATAKAHGHEWDAGRYWQSADFFWQMFLDAADEYRKRCNPTADALADRYDYAEDNYILTGPMDDIENTQAAFLQGTGRL